MWIGYRTSAAGQDVDTFSWRPSAASSVTFATLTGTVEGELCTWGIGTAVVRTHAQRSFMLVVSSYYFRVLLHCR
jgi:hypothetical protein